MSNVRVEPSFEMTPDRAEYVESWVKRITRMKEEHPDEPMLAGDPRDLVITRFNEMGPDDIDRGVEARAGMIGMCEKLGIDPTPFK